MLKLKASNWYGFDHEAVARQFGGHPKFLRDFSIKGNTWAVYHCPDYDAAKGHTEYMMLGRFSEKFYVSGRTKDAIQEERYQAAIACLDCGTVVYSANRNDMNSCTCGKVAIDGGKDYTHFHTIGIDYVLLTLDLLTGTSFDPATGEIYTYDKR